MLVPLTRTLLVVLAGAILSSCQLLIGADFDEDYSVCEADCAGLEFTCGTYTDACGNQHDCGACPTGESCENNRCTCVAETCEDQAYECGAFIDGCGQAIDCGACPSGQYCGGANGHTCSATPCPLQSCDELGVPTGFAKSCGVLISCDQSPACANCGSGQLCTAEGCCTPRPAPSGLCGYLSNGCGQLELVTCPGDQVCEDGVCCAPDLACGPEAACGLNPTGCASVRKECEGLCPNGQACTRSNQGNWSCGECQRACPPANTARCGSDNDDGCGGKIVCAGTCPTVDEVCLTGCPPGAECLTSPFQCCRPSCPPTPQTCGDNPDGCGGRIQCPGPCTAGSCMRLSATGGADTFQCLLQTL